MINWHKKQVERTLKSWGFSNYQAYWISFIKGLIIGGLIVYFFFYNKNPVIPNINYTFATLISQSTCIKSSRVLWSLFLSFFYFL